MNLPYTRDQASGTTAVADSLLESIKSVRVDLKKILNDMTQVESTLSSILIELEQVSQLMSEVRKQLHVGVFSTVG